MSDALFYGALGLVIGAILGFGVACRLFCAMQEDLLASFSQSPKGK